MKVVAADLHGVVKARLDPIDEDVDHSAVVN